MTQTLMTLLLYGLFAAGFWGGLRLVPGRIGRLAFVFGVLGVTLVSWFVMADIVASASTAAQVLSIGAGVTLVTGFLTGALAMGFARWLNRSRQFAWLLLVPFSMPFMALMEPRRA